MKFASFDLEIAIAVPEGVDWKDHRPLHISCAAVHLSDTDEIKHYWGVPYMGQAKCRQLVGDLEGMVAEGYTILTWNGLGFDFDILAEESGLLSRCRELALAHVDPMFQIVAVRGHYLGLDTAAVGLGVPGKTHRVTLKDGTILENMAGGMAPKLWEAGEYDAVLTYLDGDVKTTTAVGQSLFDQRRLPWISGKGRSMEMPVPRLLTVAECLALPRLPRPLVELHKVARWL